MLLDKILTSLHLASFWHRRKQKNRPVTEVPGVGEGARNRKTAFSSQCTHYRFLTAFLGSGEGHPIFWKENQKDERTLLESLSNHMAVQGVGKIQSPEFNFQDAKVEAG